MSERARSRLARNARERSTAPVGGAANAGSIDWLAPGKAFDIAFTGDPDAVKAALRETVRDEWLLDINVVAAANRRKKLLIADMDSTIIGCECIDELADMCGLKPKVAAITERAMRGELDFPSALRERVALLKGLPLDALAQRLCRARAAQSRRARIDRDDARPRRAHDPRLGRLHLFHAARGRDGRLRVQPGKSPRRRRAER